MTERFVKYERRARKRKMRNPFRPGCLSYIEFEAQRNDNIFYITYDESEYPILVKIIVKPNYDIDSILDFCDNYIPLGIYHQVIVEENLEFLNCEAI